MSDKQATQDPQLLLGQLLFGKQITYCLSGVARLGVADHMNATPMAVEEIAGKTGAHAPSLYRVMRMLASMGVFKEEQGKRFALRPADCSKPTPRARCVFTPNPAALVAWSAKRLSSAGSVSPIAAKATIVVASFRRAITSSLGLSFRSSSHAYSRVHSIKLRISG